jgi:hypothetical protein
MSGIAPQPGIGNPQFFEDRCRFAAMRRASDQRLAIGGKHAADFGKYPLPKKVAPQRNLIVAFIFDPGQTMAPRVISDFSARDREQRPYHGDRKPGRAATDFLHCGQAAHPGAAQKLQQHGFRLVVEMVSEQQKIRGVGGKGAMALPACLRFQAQPSLRYAHALYRQRHLPLPAQIDAERLPLRRLRTQSMIDVDRGQ